MKLFKKDWTAEESDHWTVHDLLAAVLSALSFFLVTVGVAGAALLQTWGFITLVTGLLAAWLMFKIIDPKLKALSEAYEHKQQEYLENLERRVRWESSDGD